jgi:hypothetical protein
MVLTTSPKWGFFNGDKTMSWYNRKPRIKEQPKHLPHHYTSPIADKIMEEAKKTGPSKTTQQKIPTGTNK